MKNPLTLLLLLTSTALAQSKDVVSSLNINAAAQTATAQMSHDFGFPNGVKSATYTFTCPQGSLSVASYVEPDLSDLMSADNSQKLDPDATKLFQSANLVNAKPPYALFRVKNGTYKVFCKNGLLVSDFSEFGKKNTMLTTPGNNVSFLNDIIYMGRVTLSVPVLDSKITLVAPQDFKSLDQTKAFALGTAGMLAPDIIASQPGSALFLYNAKNNTLVPLEYDGKTGKQENIFNIAVPVERTLVFYYTNNYKQDVGWYKITLDLKNFQTWNETSAKPKGATMTP